MSVQALPLRLDILASDAEQWLVRLQPPKTSMMQFVCEGVPFQLHYTPENGKVRLEVWAELGALPYTAESPQRRRMLVTILNAAQSLKQARFGVSAECQMIVAGAATLDACFPPLETIFVSLVPFLQEALPFARLIGECL